MPENTQIRTAHAQLEFPMFQKCDEKVVSYHLLSSTSPSNSMTPSPSAECKICLSRHCLSRMKRMLPSSTFDPDTMAPTGDSVLLRRLWLELFIWAVSDLGHHLSTVDFLLNLLRRVSTNWVCFVNDLLDRRSSIRTIFSFT